MVTIVSDSLPMCEHREFCRKCNTTHACGHPSPYALIRAKPWEMDVAAAKGNGVLPGGVDPSRQDAYAVASCPRHYDRSCS